MKANSGVRKAIVCFLLFFSPSFFPTKFYKRSLESEIRRELWSRAQRVTESPFDTWLISLYYNESVVPNVLRCPHMAFPYGMGSWVCFMDVYQGSFTFKKLIKGHCAG